MRAGEELLGAQESIDRALDGKGGAEAEDHRAHLVVLLFQVVAGERLARRTQLVDLGGQLRDLGGHCSRGPALACRLDLLLQRRQLLLDSGDGGAQLTLAPPLQTGEGGECRGGVPCRGEGRGTVSKADEVWSC